MPNTARGKGRVNGINGEVHFAGPGDESPELPANLPLKRQPVRQVSCCTRLRGGGLRRASVRTWLVVRER